MSILSMAVLAPLAVDMQRTEPDSAVTSFMIAAGGGTYADVARGCQGEILSADERAFRDVGFGANHQVVGDLDLGLRATVLRRKSGYKDGSVLWNPNFSVEGRGAGFGLGIVTNTHTDYPGDDDLSPVSGHLRFGSLAKTYFSLHVSEDLPMISGSGGAVRLGLGFHPRRAVGVWLGMGTPVPYDKPGLVVKTTVHVNPMLDLNATGRLGSSEGKAENSGAVGLTVRFTRDRKPGSREARTAPPDPSAAPTAPPDSSGTPK
jgi:hypothetical protein